MSKPMIIGGSAEEVVSAINFFTKKKDFNDKDKATAINKFKMLVKNKKIVDDEKKGTINAAFVNVGINDLNMDFSNSEQAEQFVEKKLTISTPPPPPPPVEVVSPPAPTQPLSPVPTPDSSQLSVTLPTDEAVNADSINSKLKALGISDQVNESAIPEGMDAAAIVSRINGLIPPIQALVGRYPSTEPIAETLNEAIDGYNKANPKTQVNRVNMVTIKSKEGGGKRKRRKQTKKKKHKRK
jgi:hypothetical protein